MSRHTYFSAYVHDSLSTEWLAAKLADDAEYVARYEMHRRKVRNTSYRPHPANRRSGVK